MSTILPKGQMTEEDIKLNYITPALLSRGWQNKITMETKVQFTDGKINLRGNIVARETPKKADYILYIERNYPIAIVEAKDNHHSVSFGLQQAMAYAKMLDVPFAYKDMVIMADGVKCRLILSHYFIPFYNGARHMAFMLHGHTHKTEESVMEERIKEDIRRKGLRCEAYNVGAMWQNYEPQTFEEIIARQGRKIPLI